MKYFREKGAKGMFKRQGLLVVLLAFFIIYLPEKSSAEIVDLTGGIKNEYIYEEYVFVTGSPLKFTGKGKDIKVTVKDSGGKRTETYSLKLTGPNNATLTRNFTYVSDISRFETIGQNTTIGEVTKFNEKIKVGGVEVNLVDYQLSKSQVTDSQPASDYTSGNVIMRKIYELKAENGSLAKLTVHGNGQFLGYDNFWGATQTQLMDFEYEYWNGQVGTVTNRTSHTSSKILNYEPNLASLGSFDGGYSVNVEADTITEYTYDLPSGKGSVDGSQVYMPKVQRLIVPKFRDLSTHWAKAHVEKLYSLGILSDKSNFFSPNTPMLRYDFAIAIGKAVDLRVELEETKKATQTKPTLFKDVKRTRLDYGYLVAANKKGIINGNQNGEFTPDRPLMRQQAAAMIVRALGLEGKAPDPGYKTHYLDDDKISDYARDAVYVASELGIMTGSNGNFDPFGKLTRAQSAKIIERFLEYLESDLKQNYRDDILFFEY